MLTVFHFLAVGSYQRSVGTDILSCLSQTMVSRCLNEVVNVKIRRILRIWIQFSSNASKEILLKTGMDLILFNILNNTYFF